MAARATGLPARSDEQLRSAAEKLLNELQLEAVVITLNDGGSYLATREGNVRERLTSRPRQVADATGAGDMVLVTLCVARGAGEAIPTVPADLAFEEPAAAKGEQDRFEELVADPFLLGQILRLNKVARPVAGKLHYRPHPILGSL